MATPPETAMLLWLLSALASCAGHVALFAWRCWEHERSAHCLRRARCRLKRPALGKASFDETERLVSKEFNERLCRRVHAVAEAVGAAFIGHTIYVACMVSVDNPKKVTELQSHFLTAINFSFLLIRSCPARWLCRVLPVCYCWIMLLLGCMVSFADVTTSAKPLRTLQYASLVRATFSVTFDQVGLSILCNTMISATSAIVFKDVGEGSEAVVDSVLFYAFIEFLMNGLIVALTWHDRRSLERETSQKLKNKSLSAESSAMTELLGLVCDVVVEIDTSFRLRKHASKFAAMLCMQQDTQGMALTSHMAHASDRERFEEVLSTIFATASAGEPGAMTMTFRDSMNNHVPVDLFYVVFPKSAGEQSCLVGIREVADQPIARLPSSLLKDNVEAALNAGKAPDLTPGLGTPAVAESQVIGEGHRQARLLADKVEADDDISSIPSSAGQWKLIDENFQITSQVAKRHTVMEALMQWNIAIPKRSCCAYHGAVNDLRAEIKSLARSPCYSKFKLIGEHQCQGCGLVLSLGDDEDQQYQHCHGAGLTRTQVQHDFSQCSKSVGMPEATSVTDASALASNGSPTWQTVDAAKTPVMAAVSSATLETSLASSGSPACQHSDEAKTHCFSHSSGALSTSLASSGSRNEQNAEGDKCTATALESLGIRTSVGSSGSPTSQREDGAKSAVMGVNSSDALVSSAASRPLVVAADNSGTLATSAASHGRTQQRADGAKSVVRTGGICGTLSTSVASRGCQAQQHADGDKSVVISAVDCSGAPASSVTSSRKPTQIRADGAKFLAVAAGSSETAARSFASSACVDGGLCLESL